VPRVVSRSGTRTGIRHIAPSLASVTARAAPPNVQQPLALCVEAEESEDHSPLCCSHRTITANQFVVRHAAVRQAHGSPRLGPYVCTARQAWPKHHRVEQIAFESQIRRYRAIVERARQGRNEIHLARRPGFDEAAAWNLDHYIDLPPRAQRVTINGPDVVGVVHLASVPQSQWPPGLSAGVACNKITYRAHLPSLTRPLRGVHCGHNVNKLHRCDACSARAGDNPPPAPPPRTQKEEPCCAPLPSTRCPAPFA